MKGDILAVFYVFVVIGELCFFLLRGVDYVGLYDALHHFFIRFALRHLLYNLGKKFKI